MHAWNVRNSIMILSEKYELRRLKLVRNYHLKISKQYPKIELIVGKFNSSFCNNLQSLFYISILRLLLKSVILPCSKQMEVPIDLVFRVTLIRESLSFSYSAKTAGTVFFRQLFRPFIKVL